MILGDLRLTVAETGRVAVVTVTADLVKRYQQRLEKYQKALHAFAASRGMQHLVARSDVAERELHREPIHLRLGQWIRAAEFDRVLRGCT